MTLFILAVRSYRTGAIAMSALLAVFGALNAAAFVPVAGATEAERLVFGRQMEVLGKQLSYLLPDPVQLHTMGGYLTWRAFGAMTLICAIWAVLAASGAGRGDEEKGLTEHWLATGVSRARWIATRTAAFLLVAAAAIAFGLGATELGAAAVGEPLPLAALALEGVILLGLTLACFGIGLVVAQQTVTRRAAGSVAAVLVVALHVVNSASRSGLDVGPLRYASPFHHFERSSPLLEPSTLDTGATLALYVIWLVLVTASVGAFLRRDVGGPVVRLAGERTRPTARPSADPLLRVPVLAMVDQQRWWIAGWAAGLGVLAYFLTSITRTLIDNLAGITTMRVFFERMGVAVYSDFIGTMWFDMELLILSGLVVAQVSGWAADDAEGRVEMMLAAGMSRVRIVLERVAATLVGAALIAAVSSVVVYATSAAADIALPRDRMALATALTVPVVFAFAGIGHALAGWRPRAAVVVLGVVAAVSYLLLQFSTVFDWPEWARRSSIYALYGRPMTTDDRSGILLLGAIGLAGTVVAVAAMRRRDVGT